MAREAAALALLGVLAASACSLGPRPDPTRFFVLTPMTAEDLGAGSQTATGLAIGLGPVTLPGYLSRPQLVTRRSASEVAFATHDRWGEPLEESLVRTLGKNLALLLGTKRIYYHPWYASTELDFAVEIDVVRFERDTLGAAELASRWTVRRAGSGEALVERETRISEPAESRETGAAVEAQSRALSRLSRDIADALRRLPRS